MKDAGFFFVGKLIPWSSMLTCLNSLILIIQGEFKSQKEAAWAVTNLTSGGTVEQIAFIVSLGVLKPVCDLLSVKDAKVVRVLLDSITNILNVSNMFSI